MKQITMFWWMIIEKHVSFYKSLVLIIIQIIINCLPTIGVIFWVDNINKWYVYILMSD